MIEYPRRVTEIAQRLARVEEANGNNFAEKWSQDRRAMLAGAKPVASKAGVTPPTSPSAGSDAEYSKLKVLSGDTFGKSYIKTMVNDHHDNLAKGESRA